MTHLSPEFSARPELLYPFERGFSPEAGVPFEVAADLFWLRMPLPMSLDHINLWLIKDHDQWVIVDSGIDDPSCQEVWNTVFETVIEPHSVGKIIVTHFHPDHMGLASWLAAKCDCKVWMTEGEFKHYRSILARSPEKDQQGIETFIKELGLDQQQAQFYAKFYYPDDKPADTRVQESDVHFIQPGNVISIGNYKYEIVMGNGHSPEHACLYCEELEVMISGDQALPRISSNVSVYVSNRDQNPLGDWLDSCHRLRDNIPSDTLILPSHQEPFIGIDLRMQQLIDDHNIQLEKLRQAMSEPINTEQARNTLFNRKLGTVDTLLATGETVAHLNYLLHSEEAKKWSSEDQVSRYQLV